MTYRAVVTRITAAGVFVRVKSYGGETEFGPLTGLVGVVLAAGDRLLVALHEGDSIAIIRQLP